MKQCPECGENLADDAVHCGHCGTKVEESDDGGQTMFGMGALTDEDLENIGGDGDDAGGAESDDSGGGFRLPRPSEMDEEESESRRETAGTADESEEGERLGLKGPSADSSDASAYAETEALPSLEEKSEKRQDASDDLKGGRLSTPGPGEDDEDLHSSPDLSSGSTPPSSGGSPFADGEQGPESSQTPSDLGSTHQAAGPSATGGTTESPGPRASAASSETSSDASRSEPDDLPETAEMASSPVERHAETPEKSSSSEKEPRTPGDLPEMDDPGDTAAGKPSAKAAKAKEESQAGESRSSTSPPGGGEEPSKPAATADRDQKAVSGDPLAEDDRFAADGSSDQPMSKSVQGAEVGEHELDMQQPQSSADSGSNQKTILIVVGILAASFFVCAAAGLVAWWLGIV